MECIQIVRKVLSGKYDTFLTDKVKHAIFTLCHRCVTIALPSSDRCCIIINLTVIYLSMYVMLLLLDALNLGRQTFRGSSTTQWSGHLSLIFLIHPVITISTNN